MVQEIPTAVGDGPTRNFSVQHKVQTRIAQAAGVEVASVSDNLTEASQYFNGVQQEGMRWWGGPWAGPSLIVVEDRVSNLLFSYGAIELVHGTGSPIVDSCLVYYASRTRSDCVMIVK